MESLTNVAASTTDTKAEDLPAGLPLAHRPLLATNLGILGILILTVAYYATEFILPVVLAIMLKLLLQPAMRMLQRLRTPKALAALLLIAAVFTVVIAFGAVLSGPAAHWMSRIPEELPRFQQRLSFLQHPFEMAKNVMQKIDTAGKDGSGIGMSGVSSMLLRNTQNFASGTLETIVILFFLLVSGDLFLRRLVEVLPSFKEKRQAVELSQQIESNVSAYLVTITCMNLAVGLATVLMAWATGLGDAFFWGAIAFLMNFLPILGPCIMIVFLGVIGLLTFDPLWQAALPAGIYLVIHIIEGETVTPMLLARRFTLNPVIVMVSLLFWFWMWGVPGAILAFPMLATTKLICDGIKPLNAIGHFLEGEA